MADVAGFNAYADMSDAMLFRSRTRLVFEFVIAIADDMRTAIPENRFNDWCSARAPTVIERLLWYLWLFLFLIPPPVFGPAAAAAAAAFAAAAFAAAAAAAAVAVVAVVAADNDAVADVAPACTFKLDPIITSTFWNMRQIRRVVPIPGIMLNALSTMSIDALAAPPIPDTTDSLSFSIDSFNLPVRVSILAAYSSPFFSGSSLKSIPIIFNKPFIVIAGGSLDGVVNIDLTKFIIGWTTTQKD